MIKDYMGFIGVMVGAVITGFFPLVRDLMATRKTRAEQSRYLAMRLVCVLDEFVALCADIVSDDGYAYGRPAGENGYCEAQTTQPTDLIFPADSEWQSLEPDLMFAVLEIPSRIVSANRYIYSTSEHDSPPDFDATFAERHYQYGRLGIDVIDLAQRLRERYKIPMRKLDERHSANFLLERRAAVLKEYHDRVEQMRLYARTV